VESTYDIELLTLHALVITVFVALVSEKEVTEAKNKKEDSE
jgi:hypothetical protein